MNPGHLPHAPCPLCGGSAVFGFYSIQSVPVTCASVFPDASQARAIERGNIDLVACETCGFAFNRSFDPRLIALGARYESSQAASPHFNTYAAALARSWVDRYHLKGKTILEVGCGDGNFLRRLLDAGVGRAIGIDPQSNAAGTADDAPHGLEIIPRLFDASMPDIEADALVCRHTLEHIDDVHGFLTLLRRWAARARRRVLLLDLPDAERIFTERAFWDIYYEHCNYFTTETLRRAFEFAGLRILALTREFQGQYLRIEAAAGPPPNPEPIDASAERAAYQSFAAETQASLQRCEGALARLRTLPSPLVLWQGGAKTVGFLSALSHPEVIDAAVDVNPHRQGIFLPASGLPVYAPQMLRQLKPRNVILMNSAYRHEVAETIATLRLDLQLHSVDELLR